MDKVSVKITSITFFFFTITLILCACMEPVNVPGFLESDSVKEIIEKNKPPGVTITITKPDLGKGEPILQDNGVDLVKGQKVEKSSTFNLKAIKLKNDGDYSVKWYISTEKDSIGNSKPAAPDFPLTVAADYFLSVEVTYTDGAADSTYIIIRVTP
jgi:hypothetical protein